MEKLDIYTIAVERDEIDRWVEKAYMTFSEAEKYRDTNPFPGCMVRIKRITLELSSMPERMCTFK